jgi:hypothetical protein
MTFRWGEGEGGETSSIFLDSVQVLSALLSARDNMKMQKLEY